MQSKKILRSCISIITIIMLATVISPVVKAANYSDWPNNWSTEALQAAVDNGLMSGYDGKIFPQKNLTRAEMATIINNVFGATDRANISSFTDVSENAWFYNEISKAVQMGTFVGSGNGLMRPNDPITREEAFAVVNRAFQLKAADSSVLNKFSDAHKISKWAVQEVAAMVAAGYVHGYSENLDPTKYITRAEFAQVLYNIVKTYIRHPGIVTSVAKGNVVVTSGNIIIENTIIAGDLIIGDGVGNGTVTLNNVNVTGRIIVRGNANVIKNVVIPVTSITLSNQSVTIAVGGTQQLVSTLMPVNATNKDITWSSNDTSIATVDSNGLIRAIAKGTAVITVKTDDGNKTATCVVTVNSPNADGNGSGSNNNGSGSGNNNNGSDSGSGNNDDTGGGGIYIVPVAGVSVLPTTTTLTVGVTQELVATVLPSNATYKGVVWSSNNTAIAKVSSKGVVTAVSVGTAIITVRTNDGNFIATSTITVIESQPILKYQITDPAEIATGFRRMTLYNQDGTPVETAIVCVLIYDSSGIVQALDFKSGYFDILSTTLEGKTFKAVYGMKAAQFINLSSTEQAAVAVTMTQIATPNNDTSVSGITVRGKTALPSSGTSYSVELDYATILSSIVATDILVTLTDNNASVGIASTMDGGATWSLLVTAANGTTQVTYVIHITVSSTLPTPILKYSLSTPFEIAAGYKRLSLLNESGTTISINELPVCVLIYKDSTVVQALDFTYNPYYDVPDTVLSGATFKYVFGKTFSQWNKLIPTEKDAMLTYLSEYIQ